MSMLIFIIIIAVIVYKFSKKQSEEAGNRTNQRMWSESAHELGLNLHPANEESVFPSMSGMADGMMVEVWGDFDEKGFALVFCRVDFARHLPFRLSIVKGDFEKTPAGASFEVQGLSSGVTVTASAGKDLQTFLNTRNLNVLKNCTGIYHSVKITDSFIILGAAGINTGTEMSSFIERTVSAGRTLSGGHTVSMTSMERPAIVPVEDSREISIPVSPKVERNIMPGTISVPEELPPPEVVTQHPAAEETSPDVLPLPEQPETPDITIPEPSPLTRPEPVVPQEAENTEMDLSAESFAKVLFSASFPGEKEKALFSSQIGKTVCWSGSLKSVYPYSSDFVFGKGPGAKAVFEICEVTSGYGMKNKVKATVSFGEEVLPVLKGQTGKVFTFSGTLLKMEPFSKEILLEKGSLAG